MEENGEQDRYVAQLREVFDSCDIGDCGYLDYNGLTNLCQQLLLEDQATLLISRLLGEDPEARVDFNEFKEGFISLLAQSLGDPNDELTWCSPDREAPPKYVHGDKKYGRRSRPDSSELGDTDSDVPSEFSDPDVFIFEASKAAESQSSLALELDGASSSSAIPHNPLYHLEKKRRIESPLVEKKEDRETFEIDSNPASRNESQLLNSEADEEYVRSIWRKLDVGANGFLILEELERVCEHIGMEKMTQTVMSQLFAKLDMDQDGKISFEEFLHLFKNGEPINKISQEKVSKMNAELWTTTPSPKMQCHPQTQEERMETTIGSSSESGVFSCIDPLNSGYGDPETVIELWDSLGYSGSSQLLKKLGFNLSSKIRLQDLSILLEDSLHSSEDSELHHLAVLTVHHELQHIKTTFNQIRNERDKLKTDVTDANARAALLAQEIDDQNAKLEKSSQNKMLFLEKKYQEQIRNLQIELQQEREQLNSQVAQANQNMEIQLNQLQEEELWLRDKITCLQKDNVRLEGEIKEISEKLQESENINRLHQEELLSVASLKQKLEDLETGREFLREQHQQALLVELQNFKAENQTLRDRCDELALELESLQQQVSMKTSNRPSHKRNGSWLVEYVRNPAMKRRGSSPSSSSDHNPEASPKQGKMKITDHKENNEIDLDYEESTKDEDFLNANSSISDSEENSNSRVVFIPDTIKGNKQADNLILGNNELMLCEMKKVFHYLKTRLKAEDSLETFNKNNLESKNYELIVINLKNDHKKEIERLKESFENEKFKLITESKRKELVSEDSSSLKTRTVGIQVSSFLPYSKMEHFDMEKVNGDSRYQKLEARLEVAMEELEMALTREAQAEKMCQEMEQKYLELRWKLGSYSEPTSYNQGFPSEKENTSIKRIFENQDAFMNNEKNVNKIMNYSEESKQSFLRNDCQSDKDVSEEVLFRNQVPASENEKQMNTKQTHLEIKESVCRITQEENLNMTSPTKKEDLPELENHQEIVSCSSSLLHPEQHATELASDAGFHNLLSVHDSLQPQSDLVVSVHIIEAMKKEKLHLELECQKLQDLKSHLLREYEMLDDEWTEIANLLAEIESHKDLLKEPTCEKDTMKSKEEYGQKTCKSVFSPGVAERNKIRMIIQSLNLHWKQSEQRCEQLEKTLQNETSQREKEYKELKQRHSEEIRKLQLLLHNTQSLLKQQAASYEEQCLQSDSLVKDLYVENAELMKALQITEERQKKAEQLNIRLHNKCHSLSKLISEIYSTAVA